MTQKMLVVVSHMGDFIFSCGGSIAKHAEQGGEVHIVVLSYGSRGESNDYWAAGIGTLDACSRIRRAEGETAARILNAKSIIFCGYEDNLLMMDRERIENLATIFRKVRPDFILTHAKDEHSVNPDHELTRQSVMAAYQTASGAGYLDGYPVSPRQTPIFGFEPIGIGCSSFRPSIYIDISDVMGKKIEAMQACLSQKGMYVNSIRRAEVNADNCAAYNSKKISYAEAFSGFEPIAKNGYLVW